MSSYPSAPTPYQQAPVPAAGTGPGKKWYVIGVLAIVLGIGGAIAMIAGGLVNLSRTVDGFGRFLAPATKTLQFERAGDYTVYYEFIGEVCADQASRRGCVQVDAADAIPASLEVTMTDPSGAAVPIRSAQEGEVSFSFGGRAGLAAYEVTIDEPGDYLIEVTATGDAQFGIAVGRGVLGDLLRWILGGLAVGALGVLLGLLAIIITAVKRGKARRASQQVQWAATYGAPPGGPSPYASPSPYAPSPYGAPPAPPAPPTAPPTAGGSSWGPPTAGNRLDDDGA
jgi:hypothetical protein